MNKFLKTSYCCFNFLQSFLLRRRDELFKISNIRGNYPQFFLEDENGEISYVGDWEYVEGLNESSSLPEETLQANPQIKTWESIFGNLVHSFN